MCDEVVQDIGNKAWQAMLEEVYTTPKPGLVDLYSCGAHTDMNVNAFENSAKAIYPYFVQMAALGYKLSVSPEELFGTIRKAGVEAERAMYRATGGVNTHKGLIFTLGIFCAAAGRCIKENGKITEQQLFDLEQQMAASVLIKEMKEIKKKEPESYGERNLKTYGTSGIRGEAIHGYPTVRMVALPVIRQGFLEKREWNRIKLQTLFYLMSVVEDSNIIARHNPETLYKVQAEAKEFLKQGGAYTTDAIQKLQGMDADYIARNISAGGCADLLAASIFIESLVDAEERV